MHTLKRKPELVANQPPSVDIDIVMEIETVVLIYGDRRRLVADEHNHAGRLMRTLHQIGTRGVPLRAVVRGNAALDVPSLRALSLYLFHGKGLTAFRRVIPWHAWRHRLAWDALQELLSLRWVR